VVRPFRTSSGGLRRREPDQTSLAFADSLIRYGATNVAGLATPYRAFSKGHVLRSQSIVVHSFLQHRLMNARRAVVGVR